MIQAEIAEALHVPKKEPLDDLQMFSGEDEAEDSKGFMIKLGEDVLKKKEEIENIYKEEDKKKEKLKREFTCLVDELKSKIVELKEKVADEQKQVDSLNLNQFQKKCAGQSPLEAEVTSRANSKRDSVFQDDSAEHPGNQPLEILLKRYFFVMEESKGRT